MTVATNFILYQVGWFACVLGAARGLPWVGVAVSAAVVAWHLARAPRARPELALVALGMLTGAIFDTLLARSGWLHFETGMVVDRTAPYWMLALWAGFATTLNVSLRWLRSSPALAVLLGALGGPAAYYAGAKLGAVEFDNLAAALVAIGVGWAIVTPLLVGAARRLDGYAAR